MVKDSGFKTLKAIFTKLSATFHPGWFIGGVNLLGVMVLSVQPRLKLLGMVWWFQKVAFTITESPDLLETPERTKKQTLELLKK